MAAVSDAHLICHREKEELYWALPEGNSARKRTFLFAGSSQGMAQTSREALIAKVTEITERVAHTQGIEVVEVEFLGAGKARLLRIFIDKPEGITHADCEFVSHEVSGVLDEADLVPGDKYQLEVSSPGIERKLRKPADFARFSGKEASIALAEPVEDQKHWEGTLRGLEDGDVVVIEPREGRLVRIPWQYVRKANIKFEW